MRLLPVLALALLLGCASREDPLSQLPWQLEEREVALEELPAPSRLGEFEYRGEMDNPDASIRVLRYFHEDSGLRLDISLYPIPAGWEAMDPERVIAGHYAEVQDSVTERALRQGATEVALLENEMHTPDGAPYPLFSGKLEQLFVDGDTRIALLSLTGRMPVLLHGVMSFPEEQLGEMPEALNEAMLVYLDAIMEAEREAGVDPEEIHDPDA